MVQLTRYLMKMMTTWYPNLNTHTSDRTFFRRSRWKKLMFVFNYRHQSAIKLGRRRWTNCVKKGQEDRKQNQYIMRDIWSQRIYAALIEHRFSYKYFLGVLPRMGIELDRKVLANMAINEPRTFESLIAICQHKVSSDPIGEGDLTVMPHPGVVDKETL